LVCDYCDGLAVDSDWDTGFVVWRGRKTPTEEYVFATREDAARWKAATGRHAEPILPVRAPLKFRWRRSTGSVTGVTLADHRSRSIPTRAFHPGPTGPASPDWRRDRSPKHAAL
jgi:hypothetical protein